MTQITKEAISRAIFDPGATEGYKGERTLTEWQTDAVMRVLSTLPIAIEGKAEPRQPDYGYMRVVEVFDRNVTAGAFLSEDGEGGFAAGVSRMADEIDRLRAALISSPGKDGGQEVEAVGVPEMPPTTDRRPLDDDKPDGYLESDIDWHNNNTEAVEWLIENHAAIRARLAYQPASTALVDRLTKALEPFAKRADRYNDIPGIMRFDDSVELWQVQKNRGLEVDITVGDLRTARAALAASSEGSDQ